MPTKIKPVSKTQSDPVTIQELREKTQQLEKELSRIEKMRGTEHKEISDIWFDKLNTVIQLAENAGFRETRNALARLQRLMKDHVDTLEWKTSFYRNRNFELKKEILELREENRMVHNMRISATMYAFEEKIRIEERSSKPDTAMIKSWKQTIQTLKSEHKQLK